jgi:hypothetical protein
MTGSNKQLVEDAARDILLFAGSQPKEGFLLDRGVIVGAIAYESTELRQAYYDAIDQLVASGRLEMLRDGKYRLSDDQT